MIEDDLIKFLVKICLLFAAGLVPLMLGGKIASSISGQIQSLTKKMRESSFQRSRGAQGLERRYERKSDKAERNAKQREVNALGARSGKLRGFLDSEAMEKAKGRPGVVGATARLADKGGRKKLAEMDYRRLGVSGKLQKDATQAYDYASKDGRNTSLEDRGYVSPVMPDGKRHFINKDKFDKDDVAQGAVLSQVGSTLFNDDKNPHLSYLNEMAGHMAGQGKGEMITALSGMGGSNFLISEDVAQNAGSAAGRHVSAYQGILMSPEKADKSGSQWNDEWSRHYDETGADTTVYQPYRNAGNNQIERVNGVGFVHGLYELDPEKPGQHKLDSSGNKIRIPGAVVERMDSTGAWVDNEDFSSIDKQMANPLYVGMAVKAHRDGGRKAFKVWGGGHLERMAKVNAPAVRAAEWSRGQVKAGGVPTLTKETESTFYEDAPPNFHNNP